MVYTGTPQPSPADRNELIIDIAGLWEEEEEEEEEEITFEVQGAAATMATAGATAATTTTAATGGATPSPRVGGLEAMGGQMVPWTGGTNIVAQQRTGPKSTLCYRPTDFKNRFTVEAKLCEGLQESERLDTPAQTQKADAKVTLLTWITRIRDALENSGMDTVFRCVDLIAETEVNTLVRWSQLPIATIAAWVKHLQKGLPPKSGSAIALPQAVNTPCPNDLYNLEMSARFLKNSLVPDMLELIQHEVADKTGPEVLACIIRKHQVGTGQAVRKLIAELQALKLSAEPREDVETFSMKVEEKCGRIVGTGNPPDDLNTITAAQYMNTTVAEFKSWAFLMFQQCNSVDIAPANKPTPDEIIVKAKIQYQDLLNNGLWPPAANHQEDRVSALQAQMGALERRLNARSNGGNSNGGGGGSGGNGGNQVETRSCHTCGEQGHISRNCPNKNRKDGSGGGGTGGSNKSGDDSSSPSMRKILRTPPTEGAPTTKTIKDKVYKWCKKCRSWRTGPKAHLTEDHVSKKEGSGGGTNGGTNGSNQGSANFAGASSLGQLRFCGGLSSSKA